MINIAGIVQEKAMQALHERISSIASSLKTYIVNEFMVDLPQWTKEVYGDEIQQLEPTVEFDGDMSGKISIDLSKLPDKVKELVEYYMGNAKLRSVG